MANDILEIPSSEELCQLLLDFHNQPPEPISCRSRMDSMDTLTRIATEKLSKYEYLPSESPGDGSNGDGHIHSASRTGWGVDTNSKAFNAHAHQLDTYSEDVATAPTPRGRALSMSGEATKSLANRNYGTDTPSNPIVPSIQKIRIANDRRYDSDVSSSDACIAQSSAMQMESKSNRKVGVYSFEERAYIIERYRLKRSNSQAQNRLRYTCRKNLADSRIRVKGRFVKAEVAAEIAASVVAAVQGNSRISDYNPSCRLVSSVLAASSSPVHASVSAFVPVAAIGEKALRRAQATLSNFPVTICSKPSVVSSKRNTPSLPTIPRNTIVVDPVECITTPPYGSSASGMLSPSVSTCTPTYTMTPLCESPEFQSMSKMCGNPAKASRDSQEYEDGDESHYSPVEFNTVSLSKSTLFNMIAGESRSGRKRTLSSNLLQY